MFSFLFDGPFNWSRRNYVKISEGIVGPFDLGFECYGNIFHYNPALDLQQFIFLVEILNYQFIIIF